MQKHHDEDAQASLHTFAIEALAAELQLPIDAVRQAYVEQLGRLRSGARIQDFLAVFAMRHTRAALRHAAR